MEHLGIQTLTIGIYDTWVVRGSLIGAAQMALALLIFIGALLYFERLQRGSKSDTQYYAPIGGQKHEIARFILSPYKSIAAIFTCFIPLALGFLIPFAHLIYLANHHLQNTSALTPNFIKAAEHSVLLAGGAGVIVCAIGLFLAFGNRLVAHIRHHSLNHKIANLFTQIAALGYAIPATILGLGILITLAQIGAYIDWASSMSLVLIGSGAGLLFAYVVRFLPLAFHNLEAGFTRIALSQDMAARSLGVGRLQMLRKIHIPHLRAPLMVAALLVFVDVMKELPATLILRPFNFDTLASLAYTQASLGQLEAAALPACMIIIVGLVPILILLSQLDIRANK
ncbi:MAG: iron ABC transporter permease, partial [Alphaproteobacteria bacterium]|nr:iron ABC transporter permease [Alphaproteobacteria bacterium]